MSVRRSIDTGALAKALSRPGIDTRVWLSYAVVTDLGFDPNEGPFADIQYVPSGTTDTCLIGAPYAGNSFGAWFPLEVDDLVLVAVPSGDSNTGPVLIQRVWSAADPPMAEMGQSGELSKDVVLRMKPGQKLRILTSATGDGVSFTVAGDGNIVLDPQGSGLAVIGASSPSGTQPIGLGTAIKGHFDALKTWLDEHVHPTGSPNTGVPTVVSPSVPTVEASKGVVK